MTNKSILYNFTTPHQRNLMSKFKENLEKHSLRKIIKYSTIFLLKVLQKLCTLDREFINLLLYLDQVE